MTKENAHLYLPLVQALIDGRTVQVRDSNNRYGWDERIHLDFGASPDFYRIKPEPVMVPLEASDLPPGTVLRGSGEIGSEGWCLITSCSCTGIRTWRHCDPGNQTETTWMKLRDNGTQIKRPGEEWMPCCKPTPESAIQKP